MGNAKDSEKFRSFAIAFLKEAREDINAAEDLLEKKRYSRVVYFSQQCVEKSVKALLEMEKIYIAEHDLSTFFVKFVYNNKDYSAFRKELDLILENLDYFEGEWSKTRYPKEKSGRVIIPTEIYFLGDATVSIEKAKEVLNIIKNILVKKFNFK